MTAPVRVAVIGCGHFGRYHADKYAALGDVFCATGRAVPPSTKQSSPGPVRRRAGAALTGPGQDDARLGRRQLARGASRPSCDKGAIILAFRPD